MNVWLLILICWLGVAVVMALLWVLQRIQGDSGVVDVAWGLGVGLISLVFAIFSEGDPTRRGHRGRFGNCLGDETFRLHFGSTFSAPPKMDVM